MNVLVIEAVEKNGTEWGLSFTDHNPEAKDFFPMSKETAFRLQKYLESRPVVTTDIVEKLRKENPFPLSGDFKRHMGWKHVCDTLEKLLREQVI